MIAKKEEYRVFLWMDSGNLVRFPDGHFKKPIAAYDLQEFLPLTEHSEALIRMMYPSVDIDLLRGAWISWDSFDVGQESDVYVYVDHNRGWL